MRTSKPFSTVSYNTDRFLTDTLNELVRRHKVDFWAYINHYAEVDESKAHKHVYIIPSCLTDTSSFKALFDEPDQTNPLNKPLAIMPCRASKTFGDWYLYGIHDTAYLASKLQARQYHYTIDDMVTSDADYLVELVHTIDFSKIDRQRVFFDAVESGESMVDLCVKGVVPISQYSNWERAFNAAQSLMRHGRISHSPKSADWVELPVNPFDDTK